MNGLVLAYSFSFCCFLSSSGSLMSQWLTVTFLKPSIWLFSILANSVQFSSVQFSHSVVSDSLQPHEPQHARPSLSRGTALGLPKLMSIESVMPFSHLILCPPLLFLPPIFPSIKIFSNESSLRIRWPTHWSFSFNISSFNEHPGLIFRMDWLDLLEVQGTLKSLLQNHSSKASIFRHSAFFTVQLSHTNHTLIRNWVSIYLGGQIMSSWNKLNFNYFVQFAFPNRHWRILIFSSPNSFVGGIVRGCCTIQDE